MIFPIWHHYIKWNGMAEGGSGGGATAAAPVATGVDQRNSPL